MSINLPESTRKLDLVSPKTLNLTSAHTLLTQWEILSQSQRPAVVPSQGTLTSQNETNHISRNVTLPRDNSLHWKSSSISPRRRSKNKCECVWVSVCTYLQCMLSSSCRMRHNAETDQYKLCYTAHRHREGAVRVITLSCGGCITLTANSLDLNMGQYTHTRLSGQLFQMKSSGIQVKQEVEKSLNITVTSLQRWMITGQFNSLSSNVLGVKMPFFWQQFPYYPSFQGDNRMVHWCCVGFTVHLMWLQKNTVMSIL